MNCEIKFQITNLVNGKRETNLLTIAKINKSTVTLDEVAEALLKSDKNTREKIANALRAAKVQSLTEDDIKNHRFQVLCRSKNRANFAAVIKPSTLSIHVSIKATEDYEENCNHLWHKHWYL